MKKILNHASIKAIEDFISIIAKHKILFLASSVSYYTALALAPLLIIILSVASLIGETVQENIITQAEFIAPQAGEIISIVFDNINAEVNIGSISGIAGAIIILLTASLVFVQFRYSLDIIYGYFNPENSKSLWHLIKERLLLILLVIGLSLLVISSIFIPLVFEYIFGVQSSETLWGSILLGYLNFLLFLLLFSLFYYFTPSKRQPVIDCIKTSVVSSVGFLIGKELIGLYMKNFAAASVYGAAGILLVFLIWVYYSSLIVFLSVEIFLFGRTTKREIKSRKLIPKNKI